MLRLKVAPNWLMQEKLLKNKGRVSPNIKTPMFGQLIHKAFFVLKVQ